jgi:hypothetical protein
MYQVSNEVDMKKWFTAQLVQVIASSFSNEPNNLDQPANYHESMKTLIKHFMRVQNKSLHITLTMTSQNNHEDLIHAVTAVFGHDHVDINENVSQKQIIENLQKKKYGSLCEIDDGPDHLLWMLFCHLREKKFSTGMAYWIRDKLDNGGPICVFKSRDIVDEKINSSNSQNAANSIAHDTQFDHFKAYDLAYNVELKQPDNFVKRRKVRVWNSLTTTLDEQQIINLNKAFETVEILERDQVFQQPNGTSCGFMSVAMFSLITEENWEFFDFKIDKYDFDKYHKEYMLMTQNAKSRDCKIKRKNELLSEAQMQCVLSNKFVEYDESKMVSFHVFIDRCYNGHDNPGFHKYIVNLTKMKEGGEHAGYHWVVIAVDLNESSTQ